MNTVSVASAFWKHPVLLYFQEPLHQSLTTLPSDELMNNAVEMSKVNSNIVQRNIRLYKIFLRLYNKRMCITNIKYNYYNIIK